MPPRRTVIIAALVFTLAVLGLAAYVVVQDRDRTATSGGDGSLAGAAIGGPFALTDHTGARVTEADYAGNYLLVFFGYTYCPDICPTTLNQVALSMQALGDKADAVQPLFITVDPARDTAEIMADYVELFGANIVGLTGSEEKIASIAKAYRVYYRKVLVEGDADNYLMDHSTLLYLMAPDGRFLTLFRPDDSPEAIAAAIAEQIEAGS
jgi:protein SCO1/2